MALWNGDREALWLRNRVGGGGEQALMVVSNAWRRRQQRCCRPQLVVSVVRQKYRRSPRSSAVNAATFKGVSAISVINAPSACSPQPAYRCPQSLFSTTGWWCGGESASFQRSCVMLQVRGQTSRGRRSRQKWWWWVRGSGGGVAVERGWRQQSIGRGCSGVPRGSGIAVSGTSAYRMALPCPCMWRCPDVPS